jgi:hypothetical protein
MGVSASGFSVIVQNRTLKDRFPGGLEAFERICPNRTFCTDGVISRVGFMRLEDALTFIGTLEASGLVAFPQGTSLDVALTSQSGEVAHSLHACDWLELGSLHGRPVARMRGTETVNFFMPSFDWQSPLQQCRKEDLRTAYEFVGVRDGVEAYRKKATGEVVYVARTTQSLRRRWWKFWE